MHNTAKLMCFAPFYWCQFTRKQVNTYLNDPKEF